MLSLWGEGDWRLAVSSHYCHINPHRDLPACSKWTLSSKLGSHSLLSRYFHFFKTYIFFTPSSIPRISGFTKNYNRQCNVNLDSVCFVLLLVFAKCPIVPCRENGNCSSNGGLKTSQTIWGMLFFKV